MIYICLGWAVIIFIFFIPKILMGFKSILKMKPFVIINSDSRYENLANDSLASVRTGSMRM